MRLPLSRFCALAATIALPMACGDATTAYPRLLPLSDLTAPPAIPVHAAEAATDPEAVGAALRQRRAEAAARARSTQVSVTDADSLDARARALRGRAGRLSERDPAQGAVKSVSAPAPQTSADMHGSAAADPETAARAKALRARARRMLNGGGPAEPASGTPPVCPSGPLVSCPPR